MAYYTSTGLTYIGSGSGDTSYSADFEQVINNIERIQNNQASEIKNIYNRIESIIAGSLSENNLIYTYTNTDNTKTEPFIYPASVFRLLYRDFEFDTQTENDKTIYSFKSSTLNSPCYIKSSNGNSENTCYIYNANGTISLIDSADTVQSIYTNNLISFSNIDTNNIFKFANLQGITDNGDKFKIQEETITDLTNYGSILKSNELYIYKGAGNDLVQTTITADQIITPTIIVNDTTIGCVLNSQGVTVSKQENGTTKQTTIAAKQITTPAIILNTKEINNVETYLPDEDATEEDEANDKTICTLSYINNRLKSMSSFRDGEVIQFDFKINPNEVFKDSLPENKEFKFVGFDTKMITDGTNIFMNLSRNDWFANIGNVDSYTASSLSSAIKINTLTLCSFLIELSWHLLPGNYATIDDGSESLIFTNSVTYTKQITIGSGTTESFVQGYSKYVISPDELTITYSDPEIANVYSGISIKFIPVVESYEDIKKSTSSVLHILYNANSSIFEYGYWQYVDKPTDNTGS